MAVEPAAAPRRNAPRSCFVLPSSLILPRFTGSLRFAGEPQSVRPSPQGKMSPQIVLLFWLGLASVPVAAQESLNRVSSSLIGLDHVVVAVADLEVATANFRSLGFVPKDGRLHSNGLINRHLEFVDGTEIELMAVIEQPGDDIARGYATFLDKGGEGGAFLALRGQQDAVLAAAARAGIEAIPTASGGFRYVTFPLPGLAAVFVFEYVSDDGGAGLTASHVNGAAGISTVWVEGSQTLVELLVVLGAEPLGVGRLPDGRSGTMLGVKGGTVLVTPALVARPRVVGVELYPSSPTNRGWEPTELHGVWLGFRSSGGDCLTRNCC